MAIQTSYKTKKQARQSLVETDFTKGMMFSDGVIPDGYVRTLVNFDFTPDGTNVLKPRAGLRTCEVIFPDMSANLAQDWLSDDVAIKYSKECVEDGNDVRQFILGKHDTVGKVWVVTSPKNTSYIDESDRIPFRVDLAKSLVYSQSCPCKFYSTNLTEIHGIELGEDTKTAFPVGAFLGNSFYFFDDNVVNDAHVSKLRKTYYNTTNNRYEFNSSDIPIKTPTVSEAVQYGYNMLLSEPFNGFTLSTSASTMEFQGILPYSAASGVSGRKLLMSPKRNTRIYFECFYDVVTTNEYVLKWSWKEVTADEWILLKTIGTADSPWKSTGTPHIEVDFVPPSSEIMIRCEAYRKLNGVVSDTVEKAITVGFDFSVNEASSTKNIEQKNYDITTATGMYAWKNRLVLWGVPEDPTILWISDYNEPTYFPYPNNITVFDEPIISVVELMDNLIVFTKTKVHQLSVSDDGNSWVTSVIQSNLHINEWDKHLIQSVRNMLYFKSGNYYYMIVPKRESDTGELTLAPITTPITDFFNNFSVNVSHIFNDCFGTTPVSLVTYYNFLDYEFIHNLYVYKHQNKYVHFDVIYNTTSRYWKINVYEAPHILYTFRTDATERGILASTSLMTVTKDGVSQGSKRVIQLYKCYDNYIDDIYIIAGSSFEFDDSHEDVTVANNVVTIGALENPTAASVTGEVIDIKSSYVELEVLDDELLHLLGASDYKDDFNITSVAASIRTAISTLKDSTLFPNRQMLDTGYRDSNVFVNKRYRELQLSINNVDNVDMEFGMDFRISGEPRNTNFKYETSQVIDELASEGSQNSGIVYIDSVPYLSIETADIEKLNQWSISKSLDSDISFWKVRAAISGKGTAPRMRLFTKKQYNYNLLGIGWVYRNMNMR